MDWEKLFAGDLSDKGQLPKNIQRTLKTQQADNEIHLKMSKSLELTPKKRAELTQIVKLHSTTYVREIAN